MTLLPDIKQSGGDVTNVEPYLPPELISEHLIDFLKICTNEDLDPLVKILIDRWNNFLVGNEKYRANQPNHSMYIDAIDEEIRKYGGSSLTNIFTNGPPYKELLHDVYSIFCSDTKNANARGSRTLKSLGSFGKSLIATSGIKRHLENFGLIESSSLSVMELESHILDKFDKDRKENGTSTATFTATTAVAGAAGAAAGLVAVGIPLAIYALAAPNYDLTSRCILYIAELRRQKLHAHIYRPWKEAM